MKKCVTPFSVGGITHNACTLKTENGLYWCATYTDYNGNYVAGKYWFGYCGPNCPHDAASFVRQTS